MVVAASRAPQPTAGGPIPLMERATDDIERGELGRSLFSLRTAAELSQAAAAARVGITQSRLSRAETARGVLTPGEVRALCRIYHAPAEERVRLVAEAEATAERQLDRRLVLQRGETARLQRRIRTVERNSALVRVFQPVMVTGVFHTRDYATAAAGPEPWKPGEFEAWMTERLARGAQLEDSARRWVIVHTEGALRWHVHSPEVMVAQIERIIDASRRPHVEVGVIPWSTRSDVLPPLHALNIYDERVVILGTEDGTGFLDTPADVRRYVAMFDEMAALALFGDDARELLGRILADYRDLS